MTNAAGIILAGGRSSRMGRDKALLSLPAGDGERTFVEQLATVLSTLCHEVVLVVRDTAQAAAYTRYLPSTIRVVYDHLPDYGPLMGLYSGLSAIQSSHALVTAVDTPFLQPAVAAFLLSHAPTDALLIPVVADLPQVLLAVYPRSVLSLIEARLQEGRRDPRSLLQVAAIQYIGETQLLEIDPQLRSFVNINTPDDYSASLQ